MALHADEGAISVATTSLQALPTVDREKFGGWGRPSAGAICMTICGVHAGLMGQPRIRRRPSFCRALCYPRCKGSRCRATPSPTPLSCARDRGLDGRVPFPPTKKHAKGHQQRETRECPPCSHRHGPDGRTARARAPHQTLPPGPCPLHKANQQDSNGDALLL